MLGLLVPSYGAIVSGQVCDKTSATAITLSMKWNSYSSEWGAYEITGCTGVNPKLQLTAGTVYTFEQSDASNWYHPVGFAYIAGGAHTECPAGSGAECPELGGETGGTTIQYYVNNLAITNDASGFGLDAYEPEFFNSQDWWGERAYKVTLTIPADASYTRLYYFCHIHAGMSAEIEVVGSSASSTTVIDAATLPSGMTETQALAVYTGLVTEHQATIAAFDETCGTHNSASYATNAMCTNMNFLCGDGATGQFADCLKAIDCQMHHDMAISVPSTSTSKFATFARQMIPHHQNAVAMAKVLTKLGASSDYPAAGTEDQDMAWATGLARNIINVQNHQIQSMQSWLEANANLAGSSTMCYATPIVGNSTTAINDQSATSGTFVSGQVCDKTSATATTLSMKWNSYSSEWGAYEITGCTGVNPKLQLTAGTVYTFEQVDASNWYHPVGFAYIAGGAHTECPAGSGAECPELGGETGGIADAGLRIGIPFELNLGWCFDLSRLPVASEIARWIRDGFVWCLWLAISCTPDSVAGQWAQRSADEVAARERLVPRALFLARLVYRYASMSSVRTPSGQSGGSDQPCDDFFDATMRPPLTTASAPSRGAITSHNASPAPCRAWRPSRESAAVSNLSTRCCKDESDVTSPRVARCGRAAARTVLGSRPPRARLRAGPLRHRPALPSRQPEK